MAKAASLDLFKDLPPKKQVARSPDPKTFAYTGTPVSGSGDPETEPAEPIVPHPEPQPSENPKTIPAENEPDEPDEDNEEFQPPAVLAAGRVTEIDLLKQRATLMGIQFSNNISVATLRAKVQAKLDGEADTTEPGEEEVRTSVPKPTISARQQMYDEEMKLVRLRITNLDPKKKDLPGEIFTVANETLGVVKKYIPYGEATDNGYHVPYIIYRQLKDREFLNIKTRKDRLGRTIVETGMAREFALEILPQLTQKELNQLAAQQAAAAGMST